ncbi:hypothetical protein [Salinispora pacifica]|nr:hypothetical protein [Salinispora pacifica]
MNTERTTVGGEHRAVGGEHRAVGGEHRAIGGLGAGPGAVVVSGCGGR